MVRQSDTGTRCSPRSVACATATRASRALPAPARRVLRRRPWRDRRCDRRRWWPRRSRLPDTGDDDEQAGDELKHEAHAITPRLAEDANSSAISRQLQAGGDAQIGKFSQLPSGICLWTAPAASDLTKARGLLAGGLRRRQPSRELTQHECHWCRDRILRQGHAGTKRAAALDDLYRAVDLCRLPAVALRADPSHGRLRPHLYFEPDRRSLPHHLRPLLLADARDRAGRRGRQGLSRRAVGAGWRKGARRRCARTAGRAGQRSHPQPGDQGEGARRPAASTRRCCCGRWPTGCAVPTALAHSFPTR
jgi:hypothetical protein